jgi:hypothetical protein
VLPVSHSFLIYLEIIMTNDTIITSELVPQGQRLDLTADLFGAHFPLHIEPVVYGITARMAKDYCGGYWQMYTLDNGGFYMAPDYDQVYRVACDNYWRGEMSPDALGIVSSLYAYSHLSFSPDMDFARTCARHYHLLRAYMMDHNEVATILGAVD